MLKLVNQFKQSGMWFHLFNICAWVAVFAAVLHVPAPPVEFVGGDYVLPEKVRAGDEFYVHRNFRVHRAGSVQVTRVMLRGDCKEKCDIIDLPSSVRYLGPSGKFENNGRMLTVPKSTPPGVWRLQFTVLWDDRWGRSHEISLPELNLEVLP